MRICLVVVCLLPFSMFAQDSVTTLTGQPLVTGASNGPIATALFNDPAALVADAAGNLFVADSRNHVIRRISTNGIVSTFAGQSGTPGSADGIAAARFETPTGIALAPNGDLYVSDTGNHTIRRVTPAGAVTTFAGMAGQSGFTDGAGSAARFNSPLGLAVATDRTIFIADSNNHAIRRITRARIVTTWAGVPGADGSTDGERLTATFSKPAELAFDKHGNLFVADSFNHLIRKISPAGKVSTVTGVAGADGSADGSNGQARLFNPYGVAIHPDGSLIVSDTYNELLRIVLAPVTLSVHVSGDGAAISWQSLVGKTYQPQYQSELGPGPWVNLGLPVTATTLNTSVSDNSAGPGGRIYRAIVQP